MPKHRLSTISRSNKKHKKGPETADDFLLAGIEFEESGDKWRPGDKLKAGRFYMKAIGAYEATLAKNTRVFDAAYNRARVQYLLAQQPAFFHSAQDIPKDLLEVALQSHRECLILKPENEDALFNIGQVLCSIADALVEYKATPPAAKARAVECLEEAIGVFQKVLSIQEVQYASFEAQKEIRNEQSPQGIHPIDGPITGTPLGEDDGDDVMDEGDDDNPSGSEKEQWAVVESPVTLDEILDTALAQLEAFTSLCPLSIENYSKPLSWTKDSANALLLSRIIPLAQTTNREQEVSLARANFLVSVAEATFRSSTTATTTPNSSPATGTATTQTLLTAWEVTLKTAFQGSTLWPLSTSFQSLCDKVDAHILLATTASEYPFSYPLSWRQFSLAAATLSAAATLDPLKPEIYIARGDVEILRSRLNIPAAVEARNMLLGNAGVYYRGAKRVGERGGGNERIMKEAEVKEAMVAYELGDLKMVGRLDGGAAVVRRIVVEAVEEGIFGGEWLERVGGLI